MASITTTDFRKHQNPCSGSSSRFPWRRLNHSRGGFAKVGYERVQEIEDPELAQKRVKETYNQREHSDECAWEEGPRNCSTLLNRLTNAIIEA